MTQAYIRLAAAALLPALAAAAAYLLDTRTRFNRLPHPVKSVILGILFGGLAVTGTELGIPMSGAYMNVRDASVLTAGLFFGAPAGIIAGLIGGAERWLAVYWGGGTYTRLACTLATCMAGIYAALLRKFMLDNRKPGWLLSFAVGVVMEVIHMMLVFLTNMEDAEQAAKVVHIMAIPMILANGLSVATAGAAIGLLSGEFRQKARLSTISQTIQRWLMVAVILAFILTSYFIYGLQNAISVRQTDALLDLALNEISDDISDASDEHLLLIAQNVADEQGGDGLDAFIPRLEELQKRYSLAEISLVDRDGILFAGTVQAYVDAHFDMAGGSQSAEFLCLLNGETQYVQPYQPTTYSADTWRKYAGVKTDFGFLQVGLDSDGFHQDIASAVLNVTRNRHVGETGFILILDGDFHVVSSPADFRLESLADAVGENTRSERETFALTIDKTEYFCRYATAEGFYIAAFLPEEEALHMRNLILYVNGFMEVLVFAMLFGMVYQLIRRVVVSRIVGINRCLKHITEGDLSVQVNERSQKEFSILSDDINSTVDTLKRYIAEAEKRIAEELEFARNIQLSALPQPALKLPNGKNAALFACTDPAREVGGDFYDLYLTDGVLNLLMADVSGKGIPAAMFMMRAKTQLRSLTESGLDPAQVLTRGNAALCEGNDADMFVTVWQCGIDLKTGFTRYASAGHNPPLIKKAGGRFEYLRTRPGFVLAGMDGVRYKTFDLTLEPGDVLYLYTDGVTEATDCAGALFGEDRLLEALNRADTDDMQTLCGYVRKSVDAFVDGAEQFDDMTMLAYRYEPAADGCGCRETP